jgi:hypothetical protein
MFGKLTGLVVLCVVVFSIVSPINIEVMHAGSKDKVLAVLDLCHVSNPLQPSTANTPFCPGEICDCPVKPGFTGFYEPLPSVLKCPLFASEKEDPPRRSSLI